MLPTTAARIAEITGGSLVGGADGTETVDGSARVDSRLIGPGDLFAAFDGERTDGHAHARAARDAGAPLALVSRDVDVPAVRVDDVRDALGALARVQLERARAERTDRGAAPLVVIAVTGSAGKTGTKDLLADLLGTTGETIAPIGSFNNELGLPLTVLGLTSGTRFLVLEMGARGIGHITHLTDIARPDIALVLNIGSAHLGEFGSVDAIARAKGEIIEALTPTGRAVLNADDPRSIGLAPRTAAPVVSWGLGGTGDVTGADLDLDENAHARFTLTVPDGLRAVDGTPVTPTTREITLRMIGEHQAANALAATTAALLAGVDVEAAARALEAATPRSGQRMESHELPRGITLINDAYNANPDSMRLALRTLAHIGRTRRTVAVLGEMLELGEDSIDLHDGIGRLAVRLNIGQLISVGDGARPIHQGATLEGSFGGESLHVDTVEDAVAVLERSVRPGDVILLKSSRDAGLRRVGPLLQARLDPQPEDTTGKADA
ncbi:MAG: UDP-N-acetylmuramoyl-tripeptide--D-alanyl-D-alanine ligase [Brachybacterium sp.]|nr:UDP-N-acetylmuramoyl-tripeptide--D-alanyl-D-alanine ligase [Brachybacterium sp.]